VKLKPMQVARRFRYVLLGLLLYGIFCVIGGTYLADASLHPRRRPLTQDEIAAMRESVHALNTELQESSLTTGDGVVLRAWLISPRAHDGDDVILLHGLSDNRVGMEGYAKLLIAHGYTVLMPDARAHGVSGGDLATYGLLERQDIRKWVDFLEKRDHPQCIFGFGESMGAAQLLQALDRDSHFCAVAVESSFANFREVAYDRMGQPFNLGPWVGRTLLRPVVEVGLLRARWKYGVDLRRVSPEDSVAATTVPVLLIHGQADSNIPVRHSQIILRRAIARGSEVQLWEVARAGHCGAINAAPGEFEQHLLGWFASHSKQTPQVAIIRR
jgi:uncharacterized protein